MIIAQFRTKKPGFAIISLEINNDLSNMAVLLLGIPEEEYPIYGYIGNWPR
jgi:hypothetical protein